MTEPVGVTINVKAVKALLVSAFPGHKVTLTAHPFKYLHHDRKFFGKRELVCFLIDVQSRTFRLTRRGRRDYPYADMEAVLRVLRDAGYCAEVHKHSSTGVCVIDAPRDLWPVNESFYIGTWHVTADQSVDRDQPGRDHANNL